MPHELFPGETGHPTPSEGHSKAQADSSSAIILLSRDSVASGWVEQERDEALNQAVRLTYPYRRFLQT